MRAQRVLRILAVNLAVLAALAGLAELVLRIPGLRPPLYQRTYPGQAGGQPAAWARADPDLGWVVRSGLPPRMPHPAYQSVTYEIDENGFRRSIHRAPEGRRVRKVLLLGDSFVFGMYVGAEQTLGSVLQRRLGRGFAVLSVAVPGWGVDQMVLGYEKHQSAIAPDLVVLFYVDEDVRRTAEAFRRPENLPKPGFKLVDGRLVRRTAGDRPSFGEKVLQNSYLLNGLYRDSVDRQSAGVTRALLLELAGATRRRGQALIVARCPMLDINANEILGRHRRFDFTGALAAAGVPYLDLHDAMAALPADQARRLYLPDDPHLSPAGYRFAGRALARALRGFVL